ncbi:MAG: hypothetical protein DRJ96_05360 [Thermoprotei archaeon]|nr:MAG: hypothetical protein DRJ96_05360 [Thermoprotei archaeon]
MEMVAPSRVKGKKVTILAGKRLVQVTGATYEIRGGLKELGFKWDSLLRTWRYSAIRPGHFGTVPPDLVERVKELAEKAGLEVEVRRL